MSWLNRVFFVVSLGVSSVAWSQCPCGCCQLNASVSSQSSVVTAKRVVTLAQLEGTWTQVVEEGAAKRPVKLVVAKNGTFQWVGADFRSTGKLAITGDELTFDYHTIDGKPVNEGPVRMKVKLDLESLQFSVNQNRYALQPSAR